MATRRKSPQLDKATSKRKHRVDKDACNLHPERFVECSFGNGDSVNDLAVASMAVASKWTSVLPALEKTRDFADPEKTFEDSNSSKMSGSSCFISAQSEPIDGTESKAIHVRGDSANHRTDLNQSLSSNSKDSCCSALIEKPVNSRSVELLSDEMQMGKNTKGVYETDDVSDIDLAEDLAEMGDDDEDATFSFKSHDSYRKNFPNQEAPKTEHEIDPYRCPTAQLESLGISVQNINPVSSTSNNGRLSVDRTFMKRLKVAGVIRSYIVEQRTIVVDSLIPSSITTDLNRSDLAVGSKDGPLDEGSTLAILTETKSGNECVVNSLSDDANSDFSLLVLGQIMEVFGPVQRPLYSIRQQDPLTPNEHTLSEKSGDAENQREVLEGIEHMDERRPTNEGLHLPVLGSLNLNKAAPAVGKSVNLEGTNDDRGGAGEAACSEGFKPETNCTDIETNVKQTAGTKFIEKDLARLALKKNQERCVPDTEGNDTVEGQKSCSHKVKGYKSCETSSLDPWSKEGKFSIMIRSNPSVIVFFLVDSANRIDTEKVILTSGRGCDASNMYDEEVDPSNRLDFSDDEEERQAKRRTKALPHNQQISQRGKHCKLEYRLGKLGREFGSIHKCSGEHRGYRRSLRRDKRICNKNSLLKVPPTARQPNRSEYPFPRYRHPLTPPLSHFGSSSRHHEHHQEANNAQYSKQQHSNLQHSQYPGSFSSGNVVTDRAQPPLQTPHSTDNLEPTGVSTRVCEVKERDRLSPTSQHSKPKGDTVYYDF